MRLLSAIVALSVACSSLGKANNWDKPCFHGECAYDTIGTEDTGYGSIKIYGSPKSITDITPASGWVVLDCDPNLLAQDIRLVCRSDDDEGCNHVYEHDPVHRIVRLPESCGKGPFARIASMQVASDQSIPAHAEQKILRRDGVVPQVHLLSVDSNFDAVPADIEPVSFVLVGGNFPGLELDPDVLGSLHQRDADNIFKSIAHAVSKAANAVKDVAVKVGTAVKDVAEKINNININKTFTPPALNVQKHFDLLDVHQHCGSSDAELKVSVDGNAHAEVSVGAILIGHIIPPKIEKAGAFAQLSAELGARLMIKAMLNGDFDTGKKQIVSVGIPGFSIPPIFKLGPWFELDGQIKGKIDLNIDIDVGANYGVHGVQFWFPPSAGPSSSKEVKPKDTPFKLSAAADISAKGTIEGHIIPSVKLGFEVLGGKAKADVYLDIDAYAKVNLDAQASASVHHRSVEGELNEQLYAPPYGRAAREVVARSADRAQAATFNGCVDVSAGLSLGGGAEGSIFGLWSADKAITFFKKEFHLFKKCWGSGKARRDMSTSLTRSSKRAIDGILCPKTQSAPVSVEDANVKANDIK